MPPQKLNPLDGNHLLKVCDWHQSRAGSHFYGKKCEIWADFGPVAILKKNLGRKVCNFRGYFLIFSWAKKKLKNF